MVHKPHKFGNNYIILASLRHSPGFHILQVLANAYHETYRCPLDFEAGVGGVGRSRTSDSWTGLEQSAACLASVFFSAEWRSASRRCSPETPRSIGNAHVCRAAKLRGTKLRAHSCALSQNVMRRRLALWVRSSVGNRAESLADHKKRANVDAGQETDSEQTHSYLSAIPTSSWVSELHFSLSSYCESSHPVVSQANKLT